MRRTNLFIILGIFLIGLAACNDEDVKKLPVFTETVEFENTSLSFLENADTVNIPVILSGFSKTDVTLTVEVDKNSKDTTAVEGVHFVLLEKTIVIPAGESIGNIRMKIINDNDVNVNRYFRLLISEIEGAEPARISQLMRISIVNEDFWPEMSFSAPKYTITEHDDKLVIPMSALGTFYRPMDVKLHVIDGTAKQGVNFIVSQTDFHFEDSARVNLVVTIPQQELDQDLDFSLEFEVLNGGITGKNKAAKVTIKDVRKIVYFGQKETPVLANAKPMLIPVVFGGVRSPRDFVATIGVKNAGGLAAGDYELIDNILTTKGDTTLYVKFALKDGVSMPASPIEFEFLNTQGGEVADTIPTTQMVVTPGIKIDPKEEPWSIVSFTSEEPTGEGDGNGRAIHMIDGDMNSFWHSHWDSYYDKAPFVIVVDMGEKIEIEKIGLYRRQPSNDNTKKATIAVSMDKIVWGPEVEYDFTAGGLTQNGLEKVLPASVTGRYVRVTVNECHQNNEVASFAELTIWGLQR